MIDYATYKLVHFAGIALLVAGVGGRAAALALAAASAPEGGEGAGGPAALAARARRAGPWAAVHGVGLFLALLGGMGLLARIGIRHDFRWPLWVWAKLSVWLVLGLAPLAFRLRPGSARWAWAIAAGAVTLAAWLAAFKPV